MKILGITILSIALSLLNAAQGIASCLGCGSPDEPCWSCQPHSSLIPTSATEWGVVSENICVRRCRLLSLLPFWNKADCGQCDGQACDGTSCGCETYGCTIRPRNRLMRKTFVEYVPTLDYVVAPVCATCQSSAVSGELIPVPPAAAPAPDIAVPPTTHAVQSPESLKADSFGQTRIDNRVYPAKDDNPTPARVHWIGSDPTAERGHVRGAKKFRISDFISPPGSPSSAEPSRRAPSNR